MRASSIIPNSRVLAWVSTGMRPVSLSTTKKKASAASRWAGRIAWLNDARAAAASK